MRPGKFTFGLLALIVLAVAAGYFAGYHDQGEAEAAGGKVGDPNGVAPDRYVYYPGTEELKPDEIRFFLTRSF